MKKDFKLKDIIEAALFAATEPLKVVNLQRLFLAKECPEKAEVEKVLQALQANYASKPIALVKVASGYRFQVKKEFSPWVSRLWQEKPAKYSRALLETLAIIAYRQPVSRGEIEHIRGVSVSTHIMRNLEEREWVRTVGFKEVPGKPALYATTEHFLDYFNLQSVAEMPSLAELQGVDTQLTAGVSLDLATNNKNQQINTTDEKKTTD